MKFTVLLLFGVGLLTFFLVGISAILRSLSWKSVGSFMANCLWIAPIALVGIWMARQNFSLRDQGPPFEFFSRQAPFVQPAPSPVADQFRIAVARPTWGFIAFPLLAVSAVWLLISLALRGRNSSQPQPAAAQPPSRSLGFGLGLTAAVACGLLLLAGYFWTSTSVHSPPVQTAAIEYSQIALPVDQAYPIQTARPEQGIPPNNTTNIAQPATTSGTTVVGVQPAAAAPGQPSPDAPSQPATPDAPPPATVATTAEDANPAKETSPPANNTPTAPATSDTAVAASSEGKAEAKPEAQNVPAEVKAGIVSLTPPPAWVNETPLVDPQHHIQHLILVSERFADIEEARRDVISKAAPAVRNYLQTHVGLPVNWNIPPEIYENLGMVRRSFNENLKWTFVASEDSQPKVVPMYRTYWDLELSPAMINEVRMLVQRDTSKRTLAQLLAGFGWLTFSFAAAATYFRVDRWTGGAYRKRLKLATVSLITAGGLFLTTLA